MRLTSPCTLDEEVEGEDDEKDEEGDEKEAEEEEEEKDEVCCSWRLTSGMARCCTSCACVACVCVWRVRRGDGSACCCGKAGRFNLALRGSKEREKHRKPHDMLGELVGEFECMHRRKKRHAEARGVLSKEEHY